MPRATVQGDGNSAHGDIPERPTRLYGVGRSGVMVEVIGNPADDRVYVQVLTGPSKGSMYSLPRHELYVPDVQPCIDLDNADLPFDRQAEPSGGVTCPHTLTSNRETVYDAELGLWVHGVASCRRPQAAHLRSVLRSEGSIF